MSEFWENQMKKMESIYNMPYECPHALEYQTLSNEFLIDMDISAKLINICKEHDLLLYTMLLSIFQIMLNRLTDQNNLTIATSKCISYGGKTEGCILVQNEVLPESTYKKYLIEVKDKVTEVFSNQDTFSEIAGTGLYQVAFAYKNIQKEEELNKLPYEFSLVMSRQEHQITGALKSSTKYMDQLTVDALVSAYQNVLQQVIEHPDIKITDIELTSKKERETLLHKFAVSSDCDTECKETVIEKFKQVVAKCADDTAILVSKDIGEIYELLEAEGDLEEHFDKISSLVFCKNPYVFQKHFMEKEKEAGSYYLLRTNQNDCVLLNSDAWNLLNKFDGTKSANQVFLKDDEDGREYFFRPLNIEEEPGIHNWVKEKAEDMSYRINEADKKRKWFQIIKIFYKYNLLEIYCGRNRRDDNPLTEYQYLHLNQDSSFLFQRKSGLSEKDVLLIGDSLGNSSVGMLYLASYLERNNIPACCDFTNNCWKKDELKENVETLIKLVKPRILALSMKWFPHMARILEIARLSKECDSSLIVVLGGDTASYFAEHLIQYEDIDYIIRGDGEKPLLSICQGKEEVENCLYKKNGIIHNNPVSYVQGEKNLSDMQLVDLSMILVCEQSILLSNFYLPFYKGCNMPCIYCGGNKELQKKNFNRANVFFRKEQEVRNDLLKAKDYTSVFILDLDIPFTNLLDYIKNVFEGIDLSAHMAIVFSLNPLPKKIIQLLCSIFRYVRFNLDIASLSEQHRNILEQHGLVKPQPSDEEIISFFKNCEESENLNVDINLLSGLPLMTSEDIEKSKEMYQYLTEHFQTFSDLHWGRLHAQPGTPLSMEAGKFHMVSMAKNFEDYLKFSQMNMEGEVYPSLENLNYAYIYYEDSNLNIETSEFYVETMKKVLVRAKTKATRKAYFTSYTYRDIDDMSSAIASALLDGRKNEHTVIGLATGNPLWIVTGVLGILKAGKAYLPIDMTLPEERIHHILRETEPELILLDDKNEARQVIPESNTILAIEQAVKHEGEYSDEGKATLDDLICVIYTSGSTGLPQGVKVTHRGMTNYFNWRLEKYQYSRKDVTLSLLPFTFDGFGTNFYSGILSGGILVMLPEELRRNNNHVKMVIREAGVTNLSVCTSIYSVLLEYLKPEDVQTLRFVVLGGEKVSGDVLSKSKELSSQLRLINEYGLTECTITSTVNVGIQKENIKSIGRPIANTRVYVLNQSHKLMPAGLKGEICISGVGVSDGYIGTSEEKGKHFLDNPFEYGARLYCTGDYGRWTRQADIEYMGRVDEQVKVGGCKVDIHEIEKELLGIQEVKQACLIADRSGNQEEQSNTYIYAYLTAERVLDLDVVRAGLAKRLPAYMIPTRIHQVDEIPLTHNGKTDYQTLLAMAVGSKKIIDLIEEGTDEVERNIKEIWKQVLNREDISDEDSFFKIGGNSLLLMQVHAKIEKIYPEVTKITDLFSYPTIKKLVQYINGRR